jgi:hypothetical protein
MSVSLATSVDAPGRRVVGAKGKSPFEQLFKAFEALRPMTRARHRGA